MILVYVAVGIVGLAVLLTLAVVAFSYKFGVARKGIRQKNRDREGAKADWGEYAEEMEEASCWIEKQHWEEAWITSRDGLRLHASYLPADNAKRVILMMHGFRSSGFRDFVLAVKHYYERGCSIILPDQRAHGKSEGRYICYGVKERYDCADWARWLDKRISGELPIYLDGISMGAATVLMASALELPASVKGIIADCGFTSPREIFAYVLKRVFHIPYFPVMPVFSLTCRIFADLDINGADTVSALKANKLPVLFAHGRRDTFVPCCMTEKNYAACVSEKDVLYAEKARHGWSYLTDRQEYQKKIQSLFDRCERAE